jgi:putative aldouronate transport system substrate-binding protein
MRKSWSKPLFIVTIISLLAGLLAGCTGKSNTDQTTSSTTGAASDKPATQGKTVELKIEAFDFGAQGQNPVDNNYWTSWIQEQFGKPNNINVKFVPVPRQEEVNKLNVMMAANEAPDIVFTYDINIVQNYIQQGGLTDLKEDLDKYGSNLKTFLGEDVLSAGVFDGKQYIIPARRVDLGIASTMIRKDWLDKVGLPAPTTTEEFYNAMKAFKEKDPGGLGDKNTPLGLGLLEMYYGYFNVLYSFRDPAMTEEQLYTISPWQQPGYKDGVRFMNKMFNEGLINKDFALDTDTSKLRANITNGNVGAYFSNVGDFLLPDNAISKLAKSVPGSSYVPIDPFTDKSGKHPKLGLPATGMYVIVPKASKNSAEAIKYLNWMSQKEVMFTMQNGFEGTHYKLVDGLPEELPYDGEQKMLYSNASYNLILNGKEFETPEKTMEGEAKVYGEYAETFKTALKQSNVDRIIDPWFFPNFKKPIVSEAKYGKMMTDKNHEMFTKLIMAKPDVFDKLYDQLIEEYNASGVSEVMAERKKVYDETMKK